MSTQLAPTASDTYPVRISGVRDRDLSRGLWLIKWLLALPHVVVLAWLWLFLMVLTFIAGVSIAFTGRYPRGIFEFNVGVIRWTWRVNFYAFTALGTDRYPPFSLQPDPDYPADLVIDYPERLSKGKVWVKWWLLAVPHYLLVALIAGGWGPARFGLLSLLAVFSGVALLFTGRYPADLFNLQLGLNRWCYRVLGYAALMTDRYPPFRLDAAPNRAADENSSWAGSPATPGRPVPGR
jgi:hypothetical protein